MLKGPAWESDAVELVGRLVCTQPSLPPSLSEHVSRAGWAGRAAWAGRAGWAAWAADC